MKKVILVILVIVIIAAAAGVGGYLYLTNRQQEGASTQLPASFQNPFTKKPDSSFGSAPTPTFTNPFATPVYDNPFGQTGGQYQNPFENLR